MKTAARKQVARLPRRGDAQRAINLTADASPEQNGYKAGSPGLGTNLARTLTAFLPKGTLQGKNSPARRRNSSHPSVIDAAGILAPPSSRHPGTGRDEQLEEDRASTLLPSQHLPRRPAP